MSNKKTKNIHIQSINHTIKKQMQQQEQRQQQQNLHSQSSNEIEFAHSDVSLNQNHENLSQFFAALQKLLATMITYTSPKQNEKHNARNLNVQNTNTSDLLLQNNTPSLYPNDNNYYYYSGKQTNQKKNRQKIKKYFIYTKKISNTFWNL